HHFPAHYLSTSLHDSLNQLVKQNYLDRQGYIMGSQTAGSDSAGSDRIVPEQYSHWWHRGYFQKVAAIHTPHFLGLKTASPVRWPIHIHGTPQAGYLDQGRQVHASHQYSRPRRRPRYKPEFHVQFSSGAFAGPYAGCSVPDKATFFQSRRAVPV